MRILLVIFFFLSCGSHRDRIVDLKEIGWSFQMPSNITFFDSTFNEKGQIDRSSWDTSSFDPKPRVELFWIKPDKRNYFNTIVYFDTSDYTKWLQDVKEQSKFYILLANETPEIKVLDTLISVENIGGFYLQKEYIKIFNFVTKDTTHSYQFSRKYKNYSIYMNIQYSDVEIGEDLMEILKTSKFYN